MRCSISGLLLTTAWRILRLQMAEIISRCGGHVKMHSTGVTMWNNLYRIIFAFPISS